MDRNIESVSPKCVGKDGESCGILSRAVCEGEVVIGEVIIEGNDGSVKGNDGSVKGNDGSVKGNDGSVKGNDGSIGADIKGMGCVGNNNDISVKVEEREVIEGDGTNDNEDKVIGGCWLDVDI